MSLHRYPPRSLIGDYTRSGLGLALTFPPLMLFSPTSLISAVLVLTGGLCAFFLLRTIERHRTIVSVDDEMIAVSGLTASTLRWDELEKLELSYYSVRRDRSGGWMQLTLRKPVTRANLAALRVTGD
jgi:hypothetical protein